MYSLNVHVRNSNISGIIDILPCPDFRITKPFKLVKLQTKVLVTKI